MEDFLSLEENNPLAPIDLSIFKDHIEESLLGILSSLPKVEKTLIVDKSCVSALTRESYLYTQVLNASSIFL